MRSVFAQLSSIALVIVLSALACIAWARSLPPWKPRSELDLGSGQRLLVEEERFWEVNGSQLRYRLQRGAEVLWADTIARHRGDLMLVPSATAPNLIVVVPKNNPFTIVFVHDRATGASWPDHAFRGVTKPVAAQALEELNAGRAPTSSAYSLDHPWR